MDVTKDNKGTSLIELVIALMISAIVILMIMFFVDNASKGFRRTNNDVNIQIEAQTIINQLSNLAMEAIEMEDYQGIAEERRFIFKYKENEYYTIISHNSFLYQIATASSEEAKAPSIYSKEQHLLAEYVDELIITNTNYDDYSSRYKSLVIDLSLSLGGDSESISKTVKFRNSR